jgi:hypothetical protein
MKKQIKGKIKLLEKNCIPFEIREDYNGTPAVVLDDLKGNTEILKYQHPLLTETLKKINITYNY